MSVPTAILEFTNVCGVPIGRGIGAFSVKLAILPFTNVFGPLGCACGTKAISQFTLVPCVGLPKLMIYLGLPRCLKHLHYIINLEDFCLQARK